MGKVRVLLVCTSNICRSPTAQAVLTHLINATGASESIECDSAGTHDYHAGEAPDKRACMAAARRGYVMDQLVARQATVQDFEVFDWILAMDKRNLEILQRMCPPQYLHKLALFGGVAARDHAREVPDPYFGSPRGFELVLDLVEEMSMEVLQHLKSDLTSSPQATSAQGATS